MYRYQVRPAEQPVDFSNWNAACWNSAQELKLEYRHVESSDHLPDVRVKLLYDNHAVYGLFRVDDRYVRAVHQGNQAAVCLDSCVEFFVCPADSAGYFSFEMNCGGSLLAFFIRDWTRTATGFADYEILPDALLDTVKRFPSLPPLVEPELPGPIVWTMGFEVPLDYFRSRTQLPASLKGQLWRGNFFKCGDETSHPHWLAWHGGQELNFHLPAHFGELEFV